MLRFCLKKSKSSKRKGVYYFKTAVSVGRNGSDEQQEIAKPRNSSENFDFNDTQWYNLYETNCLEGCELWSIKPERYLPSSVKIS